MNACSHGQEAAFRAAWRDVDLRRIGFEIMLAGIAGAASRRAGSPGGSCWRLPRFCGRGARVRSIHPAERDSMRVWRGIPARS
jgi:hypothetical protein